MSRSRLPLALAAAAASIALLAACSTPAATPTPEPTAAIETSKAATLKAEIPTDVTPTTLKPVAPPTIPDGYGVVTDDTNVLSVVVPNTWVPDGRPFSTADGREWASIIATPDAAAYPSDWTVAGIEFGGSLVDGQLSQDVATQFLTDLSSPLDAACEPAKTAQPYDDGLYKGYFSNWNNCGGAGTFGIVVVAQDPGFHHVVFLRGKFVTPEDNDVTFTQIFTTFASTQGLDKASTGDRAFVPGE